MSGLEARLDNLEPKIVLQHMLVVTLLFPYAITTGWGGGTFSGYSVSGYSIIALFWGISIGVSGLSLYFLDLSSFLVGAPYLVFAVYVYRYCKGMTSWKTTIAIGILSISFLGIITIGSMLRLFELGNILSYSGPVPVPFIVGLIFMRRPGAPRLRGPWNDAAY